MIMIEHKCYNMALRNILVLLLLGMFSTAHEANAFGNQIISEPKYYSMFADDLRIESVTLDSKFTIVKLIACGHKGDTIRLSPTAVVVDEKGHDYHFVKGKNIDSNGRIVIGGKGQTVAEAYFEPMPVETKGFRPDRDEVLANGQEVYCRKRQRYAHYSLFRQWQDYA